MGNFLRVSWTFYLLFLTVVTATAQDWMGYHSSNYGGINNVGIQPASIADSRFKFNMNIIAVDVRASNNYLILKNDGFGKLLSDSIRRGNFVESDKTGEKGAFGNLHVQLPSFMLTLSPKHAIGFSFRSRTMINADNIGPQVSEFIDKIESNQEFSIGLNEQFDIENLYAQAHSWAEYGFTYARVVVDEGDRFLKAGITAKALSGVASGYAYINRLTYNGLTSNSVDIARANLQTGYSQNIDDFDRRSDQGESNLSIIRDELFSNLSLGFDFGLVYEYRPEHDKYRYTMDGEEGLIRRDRNKYKYKIGLSLLDIGSINYDKSRNSGDIEETTLRTSDLSIEDLLNNNQSLDDIIDSLFVFNRGGSYRMNLPTRIVGQFDYNLHKNIYINFTSQTAFKGGASDKEKTRYLSTVSLTPRIENKGQGIAIPFSYDKFANFNVGLSVRVGPLVLGSKGIISSLLGKDITEADAYAALRFGLPYRKRKDRDKDGVSNKRDTCPKVPGVWEFKGCPDTDADGVQDSEDECPEIAGTVAFKGCPDSDEDGVKDSEDKCPELAGPVELMGCPDGDSDGIKDEEDACPEVAGTAEFNGCPDSDGDGLIDKEDKCPELAGPQEKQGCPDSDGDGLHDHEDQCPQQAGSIDNKGCPFDDSDKDGVIDKEDKCPTTPGTPENNGCPVLKKEEQEIINTAFDNLEFKTGSAIITNTSYSSLDRLAGLMKDKQKWKLLLEGHTDNQGSRAGNQRLSKKRAQAVADHLIKRGIDPIRFSVIGHGPDRPIAENKTKAGRQKNRRVEMTIIFE